MDKVFTDYKNEISNDVKVDEINLLQKQLQLPTIKHKWAARQIEQKRHRNNLYKKKKEIKAATLIKLEKEGIPPGMPKKSITEKIESSEIMEQINEEIEHTDLLIEYLEKVENILKTMTYDMKNIIDINKLETT
jgi:hypothetical protein